MMAENSPAPPPAWTMSSRRRGTSAACVRRTPPACPRRCRRRRGRARRRRAAAARRAPRAGGPSIQPASRNTRACSGETTSIASNPSGSFGWATVRRHAANERASDSGVRDSWSTTPRTPVAGEQRDRRRRRARRPALDVQRLPRRAGLRPRRSRTCTCRGCRAWPGRPRRAGRRRRCARRAAARGRSSRWRGCPARAR